MRHRLHRADLLVPISLAAFLLLSASCGGDESRSEQPRAAYTSVAQLQQTYGRLITVSNVPRSTITESETGSGCSATKPVRCGAYR